MSSNKYIETEAAEYGKLYADVIFALEEIEEFVPKEQLRARKFVEYLPVLKEYLELIKNTDRDNKGKSMLGKLFNGGNDLDKIKEYKEANLEKLQQIKSCTSCKCLNCASECIMEGCNRCEKSGRVAKCDKKTSCVYTFSDKHLELSNDKTGEIATYKVLSIVQDREYNQLFIIIENSEEKFVLYFYPGISEDTYGEISDVEDFNFAIGAFEKVDI